MEFQISIESCRSDQSNKTCHNDTEVSNFWSTSKGYTTMYFYYINTIINPDKL